MIEKTSYLVVGYDLSNVVDRKRYEEWTHSVEEPSMQMYLTENEMNIFDDPIGSEFFVVGHVLWRDCNGYIGRGGVKKIDLDNTWIHTLKDHNKALSVILRLEEIGIIPLGTHNNTHLQLICFSQWE